VNARVPTSGHHLPAIRDIEGWPRWVPGLRSVRRTPDGFALAFGGPRPFGCTVAVVDLPDGVRWQMVEGEPRQVSGSLEQVGDELRLELDVQLGVAAPEILLRTLEREVLPAALMALERLEPGATGR
jgi:hypothetical protein